MPNRDLILLETVKTHRARLTSAFVFGELAERRLANDNVRRLIGGLVLAAVLCAGCVGFSFISSIRGSQAATARQQAGLGPATGPVVAADTFDRDVTDGWGTAERGGRWRLVGAGSDHAVADGAALVQLPEGQLRGGYLPEQLLDRSDLTVTLQRQDAARNGSVSAAVIGRRVSSGQDYRADVVLAADGRVALSLSRHADPTVSGGPAEDISSTVILLGADEDTEADPQPLSVRVQVTGAGPTTVRAKAWLAAGAEPSGWTVTADDSTAGLQRPGSVGLVAVRTDGADRRTTLAVSDVVARVAP
ncbi:hypothetical protein [uncultured Friedmanniella sp.]|uniref:hypothetical protein n=1 Tax=uncultured Friedmanniella sp. TaxID=335381 RepID=UPI0035C98242